MATSEVITEKENVVISAGACSVSLCPQFGGKIASLRFMGQELLQAPLAPMAPRTPTMPFDAGDASGWDECFPSVADCIVDTATGPAHVPDHGDLWRVPWKLTGQGAGSLTLAGTCFSLPLALERSVSLIETARGVRLSLRYTVTNTGHAPVPWSWAAHPLFTAASGDRILLPASIRSLRLEGSGGNRLGRNGDTVQWPIATLADGSTADLSLAQAPDSAIGDKLFAGPLDAGEDWCALERPGAGVRIPPPRLTSAFGSATADGRMALARSRSAWPSSPRPPLSILLPSPVPGRAFWAPENGLSGPCT